MYIKDEDLVKLDGICSTETQELVDKAKERLGLVASGMTPELAKVVAKIKEDANKYLRLKFMNTPLYHCGVCGKSGGYAKHKRTSKYHRKGDLDYKKPLSFSGVEFCASNVTIKGYTSTGCCNECWNKYKDIFIEQLKDLKCELPEKLFDSKYKRVEHRKCNQCGWEGPETEMKMLPAVFGGYYAGGCPQCPAKNFLLKHEVEFSHYVLVERF